MISELQRLDTKRPVCPYCGKKQDAHTPKCDGQSKMECCLCGDTFEVITRIERYYTTNPIDQ